MHEGSSAPTGGEMTDGGAVVFEPGIDPDGARGARGYGPQESTEGDEALGGYQAIWRQDAPLRYFGGSDPRKDGRAIGY